MARIIQHRRGTTSGLATILGAPGEIFVDTSLVTIVVHDGVTTGGVTLARNADLTALNSSTTSSIAYLSSVASTKATSSTFGVVRADGTSIVVNNGVISSPSGINGMQVFTTTGVNTFTIPAGVTKLKVIATGAGGGAGSGTTNGGGGAGGTVIKWLTGLTPGSSISMTIGEGGFAGTAVGTSGGTTTVQSGTQTIPTLTATGGIVAPSNTGSAGGAPGEGSGGDLNLRGGVGGGGVRPGSGGAGMEGTGGSSYWGGGGGGANSTTLNGKYGSGGGSTSGRGGDGIVVFEW